jgi:uncharacterized membrane protein
MTKKSYTIIFIGLIIGFIAGGFIVGLIFPTIEWWAYLIAVLVFAVIILVFINPLLSKRVNEAMTDERTDAVFGKAAGITFRVISVLLIFLSAIALNLRNIHPRIFDVGCAALGIYMAQYLVFIVVHGVLKSRSE